MSREDYLTELSKYLNKLPGEEQKNAMEYYREYTEELERNGEDIEAKLGKPKDVANTILGEAALRRMDNPEKGIKSRMDGFWLGVLAIFALPIGLPLALAIVCLAFAVLITVIAVLIALIVAAFAVGLGGVLSVLASIGIWLEAPMTGLTFTGAGMFLIGLGILSVLIIIKLWALAFRLISRIFRNIIERKKVKSGEVQ